ncbi:hypothetical protein RP726_05595 [Candidatus Methylospira mobilis]|uniref:hypothetical protein n=1 Tax=Candidatus Methylospira mobilis TaxID=1808979 RepID=UPI0028EA54F7|nr:hypothetical protein [Candidatus Methylospira mobilis]WNV05885.1 hypothetical protein RP726_05595 [Candidatus Methylospira mobilis]
MDVAQMIADAIALAQEIAQSTGTIVGAITTADVDIVAAIAQQGRDNSVHNAELLAALEELNSAQMQQLRDVMVQKGTADAQVRAAEVFGNQGAIVSCVEQGGMGADVASSQVRTAARVASVGQAMAQRSLAGSPRGVDIPKDLQQITPDSYVPINVYPAIGVRNADQQAAAENVHAHAIDPVPPVVLNGNKQATPAGKSYTGLVNAYELKKTAARNAQSIVNAMQAPTYNFNNSQWSQAALTEIGGSAANYTNANGDMSDESFRNLLVDYRMANDTFLKQTDIDGNDSWQLRQINRTLAIMLMIQNKQLNLIARQTELLAQMQAHQVDATYRADLSNSYSHAAND